MDKVFTFWEPKESVPGYVKLCMETWKSNLPGYETVVLDYGNLGEYLTAAEQEEVLDRRMTFAMQSDCIRCAVLKKHGGVWLDADTVLTRPLDVRFAAAETTMIARRDREGRLVNYGAFINAAKPGAKFLCDWHRELVRHVAAFREFKASGLRRLFRRREWRHIQRWDWCVNAIIDPLAFDAVANGRTVYTYLDKHDVYALPEEELVETGAESDMTAAYERYWFSPGDPSEVRARCAGILMLHNSWTPAKYRGMSAEDFLAADTRLAALLKGLLAK